MLIEMCGNDISVVTAEMVAYAANAGDPLAMEVFNNAIEYLGIAIANMINVFNPQAVVIGGGVSLAGNIFFDTLRRVVNNRIMYKHNKDTKILPVTHGQNSAVMGAVSLILNEVLHLNLSKV